MQKATDGGTLVMGPARPGCAGDIVCEAERYLAVVDVFRAEGCQPRWGLKPPRWRQLVVSRGRR